MGTWVPCDRNAVAYVRALQVNPVGFLLVGLGIIIIVIGVKGSQHSVLEAFKGVKA